MFGPVLGLLLTFEPPILRTDWQVRGTALVLRDATMSDIDCPVGNLIAICDMTLAAPVGTAVVTRRVHYMLVSAQDGALIAQVVADPAHPGWLTTDFGLDSFWNRVASLFGAIIVLGTLVLGGGWAALRRHRRARSWQRAESVPVALRLVTRQRLRNSQIWTVRSEDNQTARWTVPRRAEPFALGSAGDILGLQQVDSTAIMPLDATLRWVDLSRAERASVLGPGK
jgi:hypothetical protein